MRVHELAKELSLSSKEVIAQIKEMGVPVKSHMSALDDDTVAAIRLSKGGTAKKAKAKPEVAEPKKPVAAPSPKPEEAPALTEPEASPTGVYERVDKSTIVVRGPVVLRDLATELGLKPNKLVAELMSMNIFAAINDHLDFKNAQKIAVKHGITLEHEKKVAEYKPAAKIVDEEEEADKPEDMKPRPPVVTFLGHVDHGKTSLLDRIRNTVVAKGEAGGITQHIGAYVVEARKQKITFIDTPGHAAFTAMRARGANLTDIAVLVVAVDDGIMPQTKEAIQHARAANAGIIVAINKIDLPGTKPDMVKQQLQAEGLAPEGWGGDTICCEVSAETGDGIDHLLEMIVLQAEMMELKANPNRRAGGYIIEAQLESGRGPTATLLVTRGTLKVGDVVLCGGHYGKAKALIDDRGNKVKKIGPSVPVKCLGLSGVPEAGAEFRVCAIDKAAKAAAEEVEQGLRTSQLTMPARVSLDNLYDHLASTGEVELKLVLKTDTQGSLEAIKHALDGIKSDKIRLNIILSGIGNLTVNDVLLASASDAVAIGFNVAKENGVNPAAKQEAVEVRLHSVIYELIDEIKESMTGMLAPKVTEVVTGHAEIKEVFGISKIGKIAGCMITDGRVTSKSRSRVLREKELIYEGALVTLKRFQNDASEVREGQECGIRLDNFGDFEKADIIEFYEVRKEAQTL